jgi:glycosyltransferase involved in cell wall biosynthesis
VRNPVKTVKGAFGYRVAARILVNSEAIAAPLLAEPSFARKITIVHNAVDLARYNGAENRRAEIAAGDRPIVGFVGQLVPRKGLLTLITAFPGVLRKVPRALLVVVGCAPPDEPEYEAECRRLASDLGIADRVLFMGYRRDVPEWMATFDVFALPTRSEPFGKVIIEAMAASRPVVATRVGGIPEIISDPTLGTLIAPDDPEAVTREVTRYLDDPVLAASVGGAGARHVRHQFGLVKMIATLERLYEDVLEQASADSSRSRMSALSQIKPT